MSENDLPSGFRLAELRLSTFDVRQAQLSGFSRLGVGVRATASLAPEAGTCAVLVISDGER